MAIKVLVLGHMGLLGNMVCRYLSTKEHLNVITIDPSLRWPSDEFKSMVAQFAPDYIVNCIGAIHQKTTDFGINYELPIWLDSLGCTVIHPGTDCEKDDTLYGISKRTATDFITTIGKNTSIIKTSIIGPEVNTNYSLFSWFLSTEDGQQVNGFTNHFWNGVTTLKWAEICGDMIDNLQKYQVETVVMSDCISKYELLNAIARVFDRDIKVLPMHSNPVNKCLSGAHVGSIEKQLQELKRFMYENS